MAQLVLMLKYFNTTSIKKFMYWWNHFGLFSINYCRVSFEFRLNLGSCKNITNTYM